MHTEKFSLNNFPQKYIAMTAVFKDVFIEVILVNSTLGNKQNFLSIFFSFLSSLFKTVVGKI